MKIAIEYLVRINVKNDNFQDEWFNRRDSDRLLEEFIEPLIKEVKICGIHLKFLNYTNS
jgi:hypothetical protein